MITQAELKELLDYDPKTGVFVWRKTGKVAGSLRSDKYRRVKIQKKEYAEHRLVWLYVYGTMPPDQIDHINRNKVDNRLANLRLADNSLNNRNKGVRSDNTSGVKGVGWRIDLQKWEARIHTTKNTCRRLGSFINFDDAVAARREAERIYGYVTI